MAVVRVKLKIRGVSETLRSSGVQAEVARRAKRIADAAGEGFEMVVKPHRYTARAFVRTVGVEGARRQAEEAVLERSLSAGR